MCTNPVNIFNCPQCHSIIDLGSNRIVVESCGHQKCRSCFIKEENGCAECRTDWNSAPIIISNKVAPDVSTDFVAIIETPDDLGPKSSDSNSDYEQLKIDTDPNDTTDSEKYEILAAPNKKHKEIVILNDLVIKAPDKNPPDIISNISNDSLKNTVKLPRSRKLFVYPSHLIVKKEKNQKIFNCTICQKEFKSKNNRLYHFYCNNTAKKPYKCDQCSKVSKFTLMPIVPIDKLFP